MALTLLTAAAGCAALPTADWPPTANAAVATRASVGEGGPQAFVGNGAVSATAAMSAATPASWRGGGASAYPAMSLAAPSPSTRVLPPSASGAGALGPSLRRYINGLPTTLPVLAAEAMAASAMSPQFGASVFLEPALVRRSPRLQCVPYARLVSGIEIYGNANTWWRQAEGRYLRNAVPAVGAVIAMRGYRNPNRGHVAVVTAIRSEREILVDHANWLNRGEITISTPVLDVSKAGDWSQVRVWHIPSGRWGARVYSVHGFIHQG